MTLTIENYIDALLNQIPEVQPVYDAHLELYGEVINHPFFGDLFELTKDIYAKGDIVLFARLIEFINQVALSTDDDLLNVVHASFIEYIPHSPLNDAVRPLLNDAATAMYQSVLDHKITF